MDIPENNPTPLPGKELLNPSRNKVISLVRLAKPQSSKAWWIIAVLLTYLVGLGSGYGVWGREKSEGESALSEHSEMERLVEQINPSEGYPLPISFGDVGPQMVEGGTIDRDRFIQVYEQAGQPLSDDQLGMLDGTHIGGVVMNRANAYFLLNFFWAIGLSSQNPILDSGPIQQKGENGIEGFASTGGWTLANRPIREVFSSLRLIALTTDQQKQLEQAAVAVYRPCCDNATHFPDCNHGMAMLGLLELMASQNVSQEKMLEAAKYVNAYWYPQQTLEQAVYFQKAEEKPYPDVEAGKILGPQFSSGSGFARLHQFLGEKGWLPETADNGGSCGV